MKRILANILVITVVLMLCLPMFGSTLATWSDSEVSFDNSVETGSLDLLVAKCDYDWTNPGPFKDDEPWGAGIDSCYNISSLEIGVVYPCYLLLWNAGCINATAYLHLASNLELLSYTTILSIRYDDDGDPGTPLVLVGSDTIADLSCHALQLGDLPAGAIRQLKLEMMSLPDSPVDVMNFTIEFQAVQSVLHSDKYAWADTEKNVNGAELQLQGEDSSAGFWLRNMEKLYGKPQMVAWFTEIVKSSNWYTDITLTGNIDTDFDTLRGILTQVTGGTYLSQVGKLRRHYMATRLGFVSERLPADQTHTISSISGTESYFGYSTGTLSDIINTIEFMEDGDIWNPPPLIGNITIMKNVCEQINYINI